MDEKRKRSMTVNFKKLDKEDLLKQSKEAEEEEQKQRKERNRRSTGVQIFVKDKKKASALREEDFKQLIAIKDDEILRLKKEIRDFKEKPNGAQLTEGMLPTLAEGALPSLAEIKELRELKETDLGSSSESSPLRDVSPPPETAEVKTKGRIVGEKAKVDFTVNLRNDLRLARQQLQHEQEKRMLVELRETKALERAGEMYDVLEFLKREVLLLFNLATSFIPSGPEKRAVLEKHEIVQDKINNTIDSFIEFRNGNSEDLMSESSGGSLGDAAKYLQSETSLRDTKDPRRRITNARQRITLLVEATRNSNSSVGFFGKSMPEKTSSRNTTSELSFSADAMRRVLLPEEGVSSAPSSAREEKKERLSSGISDIVFTHDLPSPHKQREVLDRYGLEAVKGPSAKAKDPGSSPLKEIMKKKKLKFSDEKGDSSSPIKLTDFGGVKVRSKRSSGGKKMVRNLSEHGYDMKKALGTSESYSAVLAERLKAKDEQEKQEKVTKELINSELDYVNDLSVVMEVRSSFSIKTLFVFHDIRCFWK